MIDKLVTRIDRETGEIISSIWRAEEQDKGWEKKCEAVAEDEGKQYYVKGERTELGSFIWLLYNVNKALEFGLSPASLTRIIFLATYMNYENYLVYDNQVKVKATRLYSLLNISRRVTISFLKEAEEKGIITVEPETKFVKMNSDMFAKGSLADITVSKNAMRLYIMGIRHLYNKSDPDEHKTLSYVFQAIPYVNLNYNILCRNPYETNSHNVEIIMLNEYCSLIDYDPRHAVRLKTYLKNIKVADEGVFGFVDTRDGYYMIVNPRIYYAGNQYDQVQILGKFFKPGKEG